MRHNTLYVTLQIYKHYIRILVFTIHLSCLLLSVIGVNFQSKLGILQALNIFKNSLKSNLITPPRYYNTGKRLGQIYHARPRTACSPLRQHLHSKNIVDNPYCTCGDIEDTHHFLFVCHQYTDLRRDLLISVSDICQANLNVLLCGDITLTFVQNKQIFNAVQEFIIKSKRFEYTH